MKKHNSTSNPNVDLTLFGNLSGFETDSQDKRFSRGKLKVCFEGVTGDKRYFPGKFIDKLIPTLPYTPIVSSYDEKSDDFIGHASEQQILGIVDPCTEITRETDELGRNWVVCGTVYYTERPDTVGKLAKKIEGHKQSLELDPRTIEYVVNYDEKKHLKNIEFTAGSFIGVSVLGDHQKPAFSGSEFFSDNGELNSKFVEKMTLLKDYCTTHAKHTQCEDQKSGDQQKDGGVKQEQVDKNIYSFMKLSWGDISNKVSGAVCKEYENEAYCYLVDMFDDVAVFKFYFYLSEEEKLIRIKYSCTEDGQITLGNVDEVQVTYQPIVEKDGFNEVPPATQTNNDEIPSVATEEEKDEKPEDEDSSEEEKSETSKESVEEDEKDKDEDEENADCAKKKKNGQCGDESGNDQEVSNSTSLTSEESVDSTSTETTEDGKELSNAAELNESQENNEVVDEESGTSTNDALSQIDSEVSHTATAEKASVENADEINTNSESGQFTEEVQQGAESQKDGDVPTVESFTTSSTSLTESEKAELEALKREKKLAMVESFKETLVESDYNDFVTNIDNFSTTEELELQLLRKYKTKVSEKTATDEDASHTNARRNFACFPTLNNANGEKEDSIDSLIRKYCRKG